jgi:DtxR family manganese transport transcriptional regulator
MTAAARERTALQAHGYRSSRRQNAAETAEDYVELIDDLIRERGEARSVEMAARLGVSHVTVAKTIQRLQREGLVLTEPYRSIFLTEDGLALAQACRGRHELVVDFLLAIGVSAQAAEVDAEGIEHHVGEETLAAMRRLVARPSRRSATARRKR